MLDTVKWFFIAVLICGWMVAFQYAAERLIARCARDTINAASITMLARDVAGKISADHRALFIVRPHDRLPPIRAQGRTYVIHIEARILL